MDMVASIEETCSRHADTVTACSVAPKPSIVETANNRRLFYYMFTHSISNPVRNDWQPKLLLDRRCAPDETPPPYKDRPRPPASRRPIRAPRSRPRRATGQRHRERSVSSLAL